MNNVMYKLDFTNSPYRILEGNGDRAGIRTLDLLIKSQLLYQLSYRLSVSRGAEPIAGSESGQPGYMREITSFAVA